MPFTTTNEDGETIEAFTAEELAAQKEASAEEFRLKNEEFEKLQEELDKLKGKDLNFANLRAQKEEAEKKIANLAAEIDTKIGTAKKEILDGVTKDYYNEKLEELSSGDPELKKKIDFHYHRINDEAGTKEDVSKKLRDSWILATATEDNSRVNNAFSSSGVSGVRAKTNTSFTQEEKALAQKLASMGGMTLEDKDFH